MRNTGPGEAEVYRRGTYIRPGAREIQLFLAGNWLIKARYSNFGHISTSGPERQGSTDAEHRTRRGRGLPMRNTAGTRRGIGIYRRGTQDQERPRSTDAEHRNRRGRGLPTRNNRTRRGRDLPTRNNMDQERQGSTDAEHRNRRGRDLPTRNNRTRRGRGLPTRNTGPGVTICHTLTIIIIRINHLIYIIVTFDS